MPISRFISICFLLFSTFSMKAQEYVAPILYTPRTGDIPQAKKPSLKRTTPIELPFREDFSSYSYTASPIDEWWIDSAVYINNHFSNNHKNIGIATFDVLDKNGIPYPTDNPSNAINCDTLTSYYINLSEYEAADSLYLSFKYLPTGLGFQPKLKDSLLIYLRDSITGWKLVDYILPNDETAWRTKMVAIRDTGYFNSQFQFRIINKGTIGISSSHWHLDDVYLNAARHFNDTLWNDVAFNLPSSNLLRDFTSLPFNHFNTDRNVFLSDSLSFYNHFQSPTGIMYTTDANFRLYNYNTGSSYGITSSSINIPGNNTVQHKIANFNPSTWAADPSGNLTIALQQYITTPSTDVSKRNDTITHLQQFKNYFAYDDGSAEQAYFLNLSPGAPGKIAIEYGMYVTDTLRAIDIQFIAQSPDATYKEFYIQIYKNIDIGGSGGTLIYEQGGNYPAISTRPDAFITYPLHTPQVLEPGVYYVCIMMPASGVSDSLMIALDKNRIGGNHRYYNVLDVWESSTLEGALMIRPIVGGPLSTKIESPSTASNIILYPNPSTSTISIQSVLPITHYTITNSVGQIVQTGKYASTIHIDQLSNGQYFYTGYYNNQQQTISFIKKGH